MQRRTFIRATTGSAVAVWLTPLTGCASTGGHGDMGFDPGPYVVGRDHLVFDPAGGAYALDVREHRIRKLDNDLQTVGTFAELGSEPGQLNHPVDATVGPGRRLFVLDRGNGRVQVFEPDGQHHTILAARDGALRMPRDVLVSAEHLYVCDTLSHRVVVFDHDGRQVSTLGDGGDGRGTLNGPRGLALDPAGRVHVLDGGDASVQVFDPDGDLAFRYGGYGPKRGQMLSPSSISSDGAGRMFIADPVRDRIHVFDSNGEFVGRFAPVDAAGEPAVPLRLSHMPDGQLYVWTDDLQSPRALDPSS